MKKYYYLIISYFLLPISSFAQGSPASDVTSLLNFFKNLFQRNLIPLFVTLALVYVIYAVIGYIGASEDSQKKEERKQQIYAGLIGLFVILTVWSLVNIVGNTFNIFRGGSLQVQ